MRTIGESRNAITDFLVVADSLLDDVRRDHGWFLKPRCGCGIQAGRDDSPAETV